jgi:hypothetical protein
LGLYAKLTPKSNIHQYFGQGIERLMRVRTLSAFVRTACKLNKDPEKWQLLYARYLIIVRSKAIYRNHIPPKNGTYSSAITDTVAELTYSGRAVLASNQPTTARLQ